MMKWYELETLASDDFAHYYYFNSVSAIRSLNLKQYPQGLRILVEDLLEIPMRITILSWPQYIWRKYFKKQGTFGICGGIRIDWEKELRKAE